MAAAIRRARFRRRLGRRALGLLAPGLLALPGAAAAAPADYYVAAAEVVVKAREPRAANVGAALRTAAEQEGRYYDATRRPVTMRVTIERLRFRSAGKALAAAVPVVGMFSGANENALAGRVELVDRATGRTVRTYRVACDDRSDVSAGDGMLEYAKAGASLLPFGGLIATAAEVGQGAANDRTKAERRLTRGFVMLSYRQAYGASLYRSFAARRKADLALSAPPPADTAAGAPAAAPGAFQSM